MIAMLSSHRLGSRVVVLALIACASGLRTAAAQTPATAPAAPRVTLEFEGGLWGVSRNDVRIPPATGTPYSLIDLTGTGTTLHARLTATIALARRHHLRLVAAPVQTTGTGTFPSPVTFVDRTFGPNAATEGLYRFNTYRMGYRYTLRDTDTWHVEIGASLLIRDARIELRQGGASARDTDLGFVPLAAFGLTRRLSDRARLVVDVEGLGSKQGRAIDALGRIDVDLSKHWTLGAGYRTIEGGADVARVYNFAWLHFGVVSLRYGF